MVRFAAKYAKKRPRPYGRTAFVLKDQLFSRGSCTVKLVPVASLLSAKTLPPMLSATLCTMARPSPELSEAVRLLSAR